jgi:hypothetical protein
VFTPCFTSDLTTMKETISDGMGSDRNVRELQCDWLCELVEVGVTGSQLVLGVLQSGADKCGPSSFFQAFAAHGPADSSCFFICLLQLPVGVTPNSKSGIVDTSWDVRNCINDLPVNSKDKKVSDVIATLPSVVMPTLHMQFITALKWQLQPIGNTIDIRKMSVSSMN